MKKLLPLIFSGLLLSACSSVPTVQKNQAANINDIAPYPAAQVDYERVAIYLPQLSDESQSKVDLVIGKEMMVDCNGRGLMGRITKEELTGWGYRYYVVDDIKDGFATLMACPPNYENQKKFVRIDSDLGLLPYNSRLPIVIYVPKGIQVKYQVWHAEQPQIAVAEQ